MWKVESSLEWEKTDFGYNWNNFTSDRQFYHFAAHCHVNNKLYNFFILDIHLMNMSKIITWTNFFSTVLMWAVNRRWTIAGDYWASWERHGHWWGPQGMSWQSVNCIEVSVCISYFLPQYQKLYPLFFKILAKIKACNWKIATVNLNPQEMF